MQMFLLRTFILIGFFGPTTANGDKSNQQFFTGLQALSMCLFKRIIWISYLPRPMTDISKILFASGLDSNGSLVVEF
mgnify:CR=1 FL=1